MLGLAGLGRGGGLQKVIWGAGSSSVVYFRRAVIGHRGSLLPRGFDASESMGVKADLTASVERSWSVGLAPLGARD